MSLPPGFSRFFFAAAAIAVYAFMCLAIAQREKTKRRRTVQLTGNSDMHAVTPVWRIVYASQTGIAEAIARLTADTFHLVGIHVHLHHLSGLDAATLSQTERILFIVSTYGEGNPPDNAALFAQRLLDKTLPLAPLHYAMLAFGDRSYNHFCGFGRELDSWLSTQGAQTLFPRIEVNRGDPAAIESWFQQLSHLAGTDDAPDWQGPAFTPWRLMTRRHLNPGSQGNGIFHLEFEPVDTAELPAWEAGDLVQIQIPDETEHPREYSIASIPGDGRIHVLIRLHRHPDGTHGNASGWLTQTLQIGDSVPLRLRQHERFRLDTNAARPLILIGNGSGIAGLRGHLKARALTHAKPNWLIFGERNELYDYHYRAELMAWRQSGVITKLDAVFSRDQPERRYVQNRLSEVGDEVHAWVNEGAAIYVCGSLKGMAGGVDNALAAILGRHSLEKLSLAGRYRRDIY